MIDPQPRAWSLLIPIAGFVWVACLLISIGARMPQPGPGASGADIAALYGAHGAGAAISAAAVTIGGLALALFLAALSRAVGPGSRTARAFATAALLAAAVFVAMLLGQVWLQMAMGYLAAHLADPGELTLLNALVQSLRVVSDAPFGAFIAASGLAMLFSAAAPRWLGALGVVAGVVFLLASIGALAAGRLIDQSGVLSAADGAGALLFNCWVLATCVFAVMRRRSSGLEAIVAA